MSEATEGCLVYRFYAGQEPGDLRYGGAKCVGDLLAPYYGDVEGLCGDDEDLDVFEELLFVVHSLGEFALNIHNDQAGIAYVKHAALVISYQIR